MKTVTINRFDGGLAEDVRTSSTNQCEVSANFDISTTPHLLRSYQDQTAETISTGTTVMTDYAITDVLPINFSGTVKLVGWGRVSSSDTSAAFFTKTSPISTAWTYVVGTTGGGNGTAAPGTLIEYKGDAYAVTRQPSLIKFTSGTTFTTVANTGAQNSDYFVCKPFVHPEDNIMYLASAYTIATYDGSTLTTNVLVLPSNMTITSLTNWGGYLAIACKPTSGSGRSLVYLWGRDTSLATLQGIIDFGDGALEILENVGEVLYGISQVKEVGSFDTITNYKYKIRAYTGGYPQVVKDILRTDTSLLRAWKAKQNDKLYFSFDNESTIFVFGKNKAGEYFVNNDRFLTPTGSTINGTINNFSIVGDTLFTAYTDGGVVGYLTRTNENVFANTSSYTTTVNPGMTEGDRFTKKQLKAIQVSYRVGLADSGAQSSSVTLGYYVDSKSTLYNIITDTKTSVGNYVTTAHCQEDGKPFNAGYEYQFNVTETGDARIKEIKYIYDVLLSI